MAANVPIVETGGYTLKVALWIKFTFTIKEVARRSRYCEVARIFWLY